MGGRKETIEGENFCDSRFSLLIAGVALFIVLGGSAVAASGLINGKNIKKGTITAKQIRNKTITRAKIAPSTVKSLAGARGPQGQSGSPGAKGTTGPTGQAGADGIVVPQSATGSLVNLPSDSQTEVLSRTVPAGTYVVNARVALVSQAATSTNRIGCGLLVGDPNESNFVDLSLIHI